MLFLHPISIIKMILNDRLFGKQNIQNLVNNDWMQRTQGKFLSIPDYDDIITKHKNQTLINCGIIGGDTETVIKFLDQLTYYHDKYSRNLSSSSDMSVFNYTIWKHFKDIISHGIHVNTRFKKYENNNVSWWKHK